MGFLNVNEKLVFAVKKKNGSLGLVKLSPQLGDYSLAHHPEFDMAEGEQLDFHCPMCSHDLSVEGAENFARVLLREDDKEYFVVFSKIRGELCTFKMSDKKIEAAFGAHANKHLDFVSASFMK
jgi:hypothetical protein